MTKQWSSSAPEGSDSLDDPLQMYVYGCDSLGLLSNVTLQCFAVLLVLLLLQNLYKKLKCGTSRHLSDSFKCTNANWTPQRSKLISGWRLRPASSPQAHAAPALIPGTVLANLIANNKVPDPNIGVFQRSIPDIYHAGTDFYTYRFSTLFERPANWEARAGCRAMLTLHGINYSASVDVNGEEVATESDIRGMFLRHSIDITQQAASAKKPSNSLELLIRPPKHVGCVDKGGQGGDHDIAKDCTAQFVEGWDWIVPVPDRNTGIWDDVDVKWTGPVLLQDLHVYCERAKATSPISEAARIRSEITMVNNSGRTWKGQLHITVDSDKSEPWPPKSRQQEPREKHCRAADHSSDSAEMRQRGSECIMGQQSVHTDTSLKWTESVKIPPGVSHCNMRDHMLRSPQLWWPLNMGEQNLYDVRVSLYLEPFGLSDEVTDRIGIRDIRSVIAADLSGGHVFYVNGEKVFIRGGNYIASDMLLRTSRQRYQDEVRMHAEMGLNMIRLWAGAGATRKAFYDACDEAGILVWQEFCITGDCNGRGATPDSPVSKQSWPLDHDLFIRSAGDTIRRLRNHACIALWCGGNEQTPAPDIDAALQRMLPRRPTCSSVCSQQCLASHPCGACSTCSAGHMGLSGHPQGCLDATRAYVSGSLWSGFGEGHGTFSDGPYGCQTPAAFFDPRFYPYAFNPEVGSVGVPEYETMQNIFPDPAQALIPHFAAMPSGLVQEIPNAAWQLHTYITYSTGSAAGAAGNEILTYGMPQDLAQFCDQAQLANYVQYRALLEGWSSFMWQRFSGVLIWKTQNSWAGLRGQLYDWLLAQTGGYYGVKLACEPVHVQLNLHTRQVEVVNTSLQPVEGGSLIVRTFIVNHQGTHGGSPATYKLPELAAGSVAIVAEQSFKGPSDGVAFVFLWLQYASGQLISRNVYWLPDRQTGTCEALRAWSMSHNVALTAKVVYLSWEGGVVKAQMSIVNEDTMHPAFWVRLALQAPLDGKEEGPQKGQSTKRVLPVFWSGNHHTLAPKEALDVSVEARLEENCFLLEILCEGWNTGTICLKLNRCTSKRKTS